MERLEVMESELGEELEASHLYRLLQRCYLDPYLRFRRWMRSERRKLREVQNVISIILDEDMKKIYLGYPFLDFFFYVYKKEDYNCPQNCKMLELVFYVVKLTRPECYDWTLAETLFRSFD